MLLLLFLFFVIVATLVVRLCTIAYIIFAPLYVGSLWALLYNHLGFLPSWISGSLPSCWFSMKSFYSLKKKKQNKVLMLFYILLALQHGKNTGHINIIIIIIVLVVSNSLHYYINSHTQLHWQRFETKARRRNHSHCNHYSEILKQKIRLKKCK